MNNSDETAIIKVNQSIGGRDFNGECKQNRIEEKRASD